MDVYDGGLPPKLIFSTEIKKLIKTFGFLTSVYEVV